MAEEGVPDLWPENFWREVWHRDCPKSPCGIYVPVPGESMTIEDGSKLRLWKCLACGVRVYAGLDSRRFVVRRTAELPIPETPEIEAEVESE
jgi:hypothetical protein